MRILLWLLLLLVPAYGATIPVTTASDVQAVITGAASGDTLTFADGTYEGGWTIYKQLTLVSTNKWGAVLDGENTRDWGLLISNQQEALSYVIIDGFEIKNFKEDTTDYEESGGIRFQTGVGRTYCTIKNCKIHDCYDTGIHIKGNYHTVEDNIIYQCGNHLASTGIKAEYIGNSTIQNNTVYLCGRFGIWIKDDRYNGGTKVYSNRVFNCNTGIYTYNATTSKVCNNLLYQNTYGVVGDRGSASTQGQIIHNTMKNVWRSSVHLGENYSYGNVAVHNNLFYYGATQYAVYYNPLNVQAANLSLNSNVYVAYVGQGNFLGTNSLTGAASGYSTVADIVSNTTWEDDGDEATTANYTDYIYGITHSTTPWNNQIGSNLSNAPTTLTLLTITANSCSVNDTDKDYLVDRKGHTAWRSGTGQTGTQYFILDLGVSPSWNVVQLVPFGHEVRSAINAYAWTTSDNLSDWTAFDSGSLPAQEGNWWWKATETKTARYLKCTITTNHSATAAYAKSWTYDEYAVADVVVGLVTEVGDEPGDAADPWTIPEQSYVWYNYTYEGDIDLMETLQLQYDTDSEFGSPTTVNYTLTDLDTSYGSKLRAPLNSWIKTESNDTYYVRSRFKDFEDNYGDWSATKVLVRNFSLPNPPDNPVFE